MKSDRCDHSVCRHGHAAPHMELIPCSSPHAPGVLHVRNTETGAAQEKRFVPFLCLHVAKYSCSHPEMGIKLQYSWVNYCFPCHIEVLLLEAGWLWLYGCKMKIYSLGMGNVEWGKKKCILPPVFRNCGHECTYVLDDHALFLNGTAFICSSTTEYPTAPEMVPVGDGRWKAPAPAKQRNNFTLPMSLSYFLETIGRKLCYLIFSCFKKD